MTDKEHIMLLEKALKFYAEGKHIIYDTETLKYAMMATDNPFARIIEKIGDRGEVARKALALVGEEIDA